MGAVIEALVVLALSLGFTGWLHVVRPWRIRRKRARKIAEFRAARESTLYWSTVRHMKPGEFERRCQNRPLGSHPLPHKRAG